MKIYEKPMAIIEKIDVEDVITASTSVADPAVEAAIKNAINAEANDQVILFQW